MARSSYAEAVQDASFFLCLASLALTFLKFVGLIDWSWWDVLAPVALPVVAALVLVLYFVFVGVVVVVVAFTGAVVERIRW